MTRERTDYVQKLNVQLGVQQKVLPFEQIVDTTLARDALKLIGSA